MRGIKRSHFLNGAFKKTPHWSLCVIRMCRFLTIAFLGFPVLSSCCIMINQIRISLIFKVYYSSHLLNVKPTSKASVLDLSCAALSSVERQ